MAIGFVFVVRQKGTSQILGFALFFGRMMVVMMVLMDLRRRSMMMLQRMRRQRLPIWTLMDTHLHTLLVVRRCRLLRWL
jgi:hypothetical protein